MYRCKQCHCSMRILKEYASHYEMHSHINNIRFPCCHNYCFREFKTFAGSKSHIYRDHASLVSQHRPCLASLPLSCNISPCKEKFTDIKYLTKHLKNHIRMGYSVECKYPICSASYINISSFTAHISRHHSVSQNLVFNSDSTDNSSSLIQQPNIMSSSLSLEVLLNNSF